MFVCCDQGNLQDRGFAHYLAAHDGGAYARAFAEGADQHWATATALGLVSEARDKNNEVHTAIREGAKRFRYAFLYGAGGLKLGQIIADIVRAVAAIDAAAGNALGAKFWAGDKHPGENVLKQTGKRALDRFVNATPGLKELRASFTREHRKHGWVEGTRRATGSDRSRLQVAQSHRYRERSSHLQALAGRHVRRALRALPLRPQRRRLPGALDPRRARGLLPVSHRRAGRRDPYSPRP